MSIAARFKIRLILARVKGPRCHGVLCTMIDGTGDLGGRVIWGDVVPESFNFRLVLERPPQPKKSRRPCEVG